MDVGGSVEFTRVVLHVVRIKAIHLPSTTKTEFCKVTTISISASGRTSSQETNHSPLPALAEDRLALPIVSRNADP